MAQAPNAILAINSLDRYIAGKANQPYGNALIASYDNQPPYGNDFTIQSPGALIYGYINRIIVSQIQLQYNLPTVIPNLNDEFYISIGGLEYQVTIPFGFYHPEELAAAVEAQLAAGGNGGDAAVIAAMIDVTYTTEDGFTFESMSSPKTPFYFPSVTELAILTLGDQQVINSLIRCYRLLGLTIQNSELRVNPANPYPNPQPPSNYLVAAPQTRQVSQDVPCFLYTPYIDIYSDALTNYQLIKDTNTQVNKPKGLIARIYLSGTGNVQTTVPAEPGTLGSAPFVLVADLNSPKIIRWSPDVAVPSIDFQLRDCYGDLLPGYIPGYKMFSTEFQMTLLCIEGRDWDK